MTPPRYGDLLIVRDRAAGHVAGARREWRQARAARRAGRLADAVSHEARAANRLTTARWLARGAPAWLAP